MRSPGRKNKKGYTLVEVVVASALLIAVSVPMFRALARSYAFSNSLRYKTQSVAFARSRLEHARAIAAGVYNTSLAENNTALNGGYLCSVSDTGFAGDIRTISVTSGYDRDGDGTLDSDEIEITLSTLVARR